MEHPLLTVNVLMAMLLGHWSDGLRKSPPEQPLQGELFGLDQLIRHAKTLATSHQVFIKPGRNRLLARLDQNERSLRQFNRLTQSIVRVRRVTHAAEWMLDNFYLIEEQIQISRRHLPPGYSRKLPRLHNGASALLPRVYDLVLELISHVDAQIDIESLSPFISSYQTVSPLTLGELWAVPIMIRLGLIENLQRVTTRLSIARQDRDMADLWMTRLQEVAEKSPSQLVVVMAEMAKSGLTLSSSFVGEFCQRLSRQSPAMNWVRNWLEQWLAEQGESIEQLVYQENQIQAADQVSITHSINSLRALSGMDWKSFVESVSLVDQVLRKDPSEVYGKMDFATRDRYRHVIERIAHQSKVEESIIAQKAIGLAEDNTRLKGGDDRDSHVGYYLIGKGIPALERGLKMVLPWGTTLERVIERFPTLFYVGGIILMTGLGTLGFIEQAVSLKISLGSRIVFSGLFCICFSQLSLSIVNLLSTFFVKPRLLPRLDCTLGIPLDNRTIVAIPTIFRTADDVDHLVEVLEIHYLANHDQNLYFALLTDFADAQQETLPGDEVLLNQARTGVEMLNKKYQLDRPCIFFLFHRPRRWNEGESCWMGYERKRGKLSEFNAMILGESGHRFSEIVGDISILPTVKFVITLDTDTQLPRDVARQLVGTMAHPLNRPRFDSKTGIVTEGYGILQPQVGVSLPSAERSWFVRLFSGDVGIDPYTQAVSDIYQDIFGEGSFIGKGIYDVRALELATLGRFPENMVLSHDLIEGCHARSALVSDLELYESYPSRYITDADRRYRWIRGDWQIAQWLLPQVPGPNATRINNPLSTLSEWKIFDNLRRSLVPISQVAFLLGIWSLMPQFSTLGVLVVLGMVGASGLISVGIGLFRKSKEFPIALHLQGVAISGGRHFGQIFLSLVFLPHEAFLSLNAIARTLWRLLISHRRLLEWKTSSDSERVDRRDLMGHYLAMWMAPVVGLLTVCYLIIMQGNPPLAAWPFIILWLLAPWIAWRISLTIEAPPSMLSEAQQVFLRKIARKTWGYFETFVTAQENWLPPDNFQEHPAPFIASRTSPTNMGLALLGNLTARDFGYLSVGELMRRTRLSLSTMLSLKKYRRHFYNWYDTRTLEPLRPLYISSVDSGNLAGHLLTLGPGLIEIADQNIFHSQIFAGLSDTMGILKESNDNTLNVEALEVELRKSPTTLVSQFQLLRDIFKLIEKIVIPAGSGAKVESWRKALEQNCRDHYDDLLFIAPWLTLDSRDEMIRTLIERFGKKFIGLNQPLTLRQVAEFDQSLCPALEEIVNGKSPQSASSIKDGDLTELLQCLKQASDRASQRLLDLEGLARQSHELADMDFTFLFDHKRDLFSIGFNVDERRCDASFYDLLASESRLCSYVAIAQGQIHEDHWFSLSRLLLASRGRPVLASWSGSLFEYLMPLLVMPTYNQTLLGETYRGAVEHQIAYGRLHGLPWGVSESGYNQTDIHHNYQYRAFGVPGLGLKRGLAGDQVIAPYATVLALMVKPQEACKNLERLTTEGREGVFGFYEAVDYTPSRLPPGQLSVTIRSFMAHHQGMSLLALSYVLLDRPMQRRFSACPELKAADLLLQERVPKTMAKVLSDDWSIKETRKVTEEDEGVIRIIKSPSASVPEVHLMSNGRYHVVISNAGGGYSCWNDLSVTRWREDTTRDCWGSFIYLRDVDIDDFWSTTYQPTLKRTKNYEAIFTQARAEFRHSRFDIEVHSEISVSPEDDVEFRRVTLTNCSDRPRTIELTSYAEVVLAAPASDATHPAFSNLFVQTQFIPDYSAILCTRRARSEMERPPWLFHLMVGQGGEQGEISYETDRSRFIGRGRTLASPAAMQETTPLSNTVGSVLDPVIALRRQVTIPPNGTVRVDFIVGVTESQEASVALAGKYHSVRMADRAFDLAWTHSQVTLRQLNISEKEAQLYSRLASGLIYANPVHRALPSVLLGNRRGQSGLWSYGISGDLPIVLVRIHDKERIEIVWQLIQAHSYWRMKGLPVDLVILNEDDSLYRRPFHEEIISLIGSGIEAHMLDKPGGIFVRNTEQISNEDRILLQAVARIILIGENGTIEEQMERPSSLDSLIPFLSIIRPTIYESFELPTRELVFNNGFGGFTPDGREYVILLREGQTTPAPWVNVLANPNFGTVVSEQGSAYTWAENCHEFRLTPWTNDPVSDLSGESFYIRDEQTGQIWSPMPAPIRSAAPHVIRHGFGYSVFEHVENGIFSELWIYVAIDAPIKFAVLKVRNVSKSHRRISVTGYWEWVLGELRQKNLLHVQTELDPKSGALFARNPYNTEFPDRVAFVDVNDSTRSFTGDRKEFLGRNGSPSNPVALKRIKLSGKVGAGLDPCGAVQVAFDLSPGQEHETIFRLGVGKNVGEVQSLIQRFRRPDSCRLALEGVWKYWNQTLGAVQIETPDQSVNIMGNGWLLYQTLSCRLWGRTGFYQSGGAFGFRDQLQDVMSLVHAEPTLVREHLLRAAAHQFPEGDVQHWWHPPIGRGVRTHFSDDYLWLPYVTCHYVSCLADTGILDESIPFLKGRLLRPEEESYYDQPGRSEETATLYEHCVRAIENGLKFGEHGLPLMGCGDWNDGMNMIGKDGRGESVWLAFFLYDVLIRFAELANRRGEISFADRCLNEATKLQNNIELNGWDGEWYLRAFFDDGKPLGSHTNEECQIDALPQSWAIISGAGNPDRARQAMEAVEKHLVRNDARLIQLFQPPFDRSSVNPGYIKGYIPGVRENGGQYTHAAIWTTMGFALMGETEHAWKLFNMINPIRHSDTPEQIATYRVEPYVMAADVYGVDPLTGRGGWTWYTGSAGWMYRLLIETLIGVKREGDYLRITPSMPESWDNFKIHYRYHQTHYRINITRIADQLAPTKQILLDGQEISGGAIPLRDDKVDHLVEMKIGFISKTVESTSSWGEGPTSNCFCGG